MLLGKEGNVKLCDFGWSAEANMMEKRKTYCGTVDYMAPEMVKNETHNFTLDIWCLGILLFELLHGVPPFKGKNDKEKSKNISKNKAINYSSKLSSEAVNLMTSILKLDPDERINLKDIFRHPWMKNMEKLFKIQID